MSNIENTAEQDETTLLDLVLDASTEEVHVDFKAMMAAIVTAYGDDIEDEVAAA